MSVHNWEMLLQFSVHGSGKALFGDGFAMWYTKNKNVKGPVFGNQDYFTGLAIFFDTYSNHNGEHSHEHPYISAMINNGSIHYDHDRDGTHSQVSGCHAKFRNSNEDTYVAISYINRQLIVMTNFDGSGTWTPCFLVNNVDLPTGYYFGFTAATGDLADNHDIVSVKVYDVEQSHDNNVKDKEAQPTQQAVDWSTVMPHAANQEPPRAHVADVPNMITPFWYRFFSFSFLLVLVVAIIALIGGFAWKKKQERNRKRFF
jgi:mannose-binding lectin 2